MSQAQLSLPDLCATHRIAIAYDTNGRHCGHLGGTMKRSIWIGALALVAVSATPCQRVLAAETTAQPQRAQSNTLQEVVVTAEKRSETVQTVPISITVIPSQQLRRQGITSIRDLAQASAALDFTAPGAAPGGGAFIRGIGTESVGGLTVLPSVTLVVDGVSLGNANITSLFDIKRVEVLKGPQGTLFGSSASAGVISITTNPPNPHRMSAYVHIEFGSSDLGSDYSRRVLHGVVNVPLSATSALRIAAHSDLNSGIFYNPYQGISSQQPETGIRLRYLNQITDALRLNLIADYDKTKSTGASPALTYRFAPPGSALANALASCGVTASPSNFQDCSEQQYYNAQIARGLSAQIDLKVGHDTLTSISAYRLLTSQNRQSIMSIPLSITTNAFALGNPCLFYNCVPIFAILPGGTNQLQEQHRRQFTQELRIASPNNERLEWVAGLYYKHYTLGDNSPGLLTANFGGGTFTANTLFTAGVTSSEYAAFGNATYFINRATRLIVGARITHSRVYEDKHDPSNSHDNVTYSVEGTATKPTYRIGIQRDFGASTMAYLTYSTGYKAPEISDALSPNPNPGQPWNGGMFVVRPETPTNYEIGVKQSALNDRLAVDLDVFYEDVKNYQGQYSFPNSQGTITTVPANVPKVVTKGVELNVFGRAWRGMSVNASGIYDPATYPANYLAADGTNLGGHQLNFAPKTKLTLSVEQDFPLTENYQFVVGADSTYRSQESLYLSANPGFVQAGGTTFNARIGLRAAKGWSVYLFGRNLSDKHFPLQIYPTPFQPGGLWNYFGQDARRIIGLQITAEVH